MLGAEIDMGGGGDIVWRDRRPLRSINILHLYLEFSTMLEKLMNFGRY